MSKIKDAFKKGKVFVPFITCGYPDLDITIEVVKEAVKNGAGVVELGIPFSDPTAEGPVIQNANMKALEGGVTTDKIFDMVSKLRKETDVPLVFMTYANVVFSYGKEKFLKKMKERDMDGLILPDVPFEEKEEFLDVCEANDIDFISLIAPTSDHRIEMIASKARGFIYIVSSLGVTGTRSEITTDVGAIVNTVKKVTDTPCAIGFGISNPVQAANMSAVADGVIVGSAIINVISDNPGKEAESVGKYVKSMTDSI